MLLDLEDPGAFCVFRICITIKNLLYYN